ncbi:MAG: 50S ribosomal protein L1 [Chloroflexi bacterium]|jgi:large subunit ribosomal protein L1|nr:MAG: 50S ribosomal protein L1 [Chloroflexota bacterium]RLT29709.1 MAG: 50S ribosomal protein L1 [Chloroflexota bacterium]
MAKHGKRYIEAAKLIDPEKLYTPAEAAALLKKTATAKFDQTIEVHIRLGVDPRQSDEMVRGTIGLPHGTGKKLRIVVFAQGDKAAEATKAGADVVGAADLVAKIDGGWMEFDIVIATPDMMGQVGKLGKVLGRKGLMPNPKAGTITMDLERTISELKSGRVEYKVDKIGAIHLGIGKASFTEDQIVGNLSALVDAVNRAKPTGLKGTYLKGISVATSMGPGVAIDVPALLALAG